MIVYNFVWMKSSLISRSWGWLMKIQIWIKRIFVCRTPIKATELGLHDHQCSMPVWRHSCMDYTPAAPVVDSTLYTHTSVHWMITLQFCSAPVYMSFSPTTSVLKNFFKAFLAAALMVSLTGFKSSSACKLTFLSGLSFWYSCTYRASIRRWSNPRV